MRLSALALISSLTLAACSSPTRAPQQDPKLIAQVEVVMRKHRAEFQACFDREPGNLKSKPSGTIMIRFAVGAKDGKLIGAAVQELGTTLDEPGVATCLLDVLVSTQFQRPETRDGQDLQVLYPFTFNAGALPKGGDHL